MNRRMRIVLGVTILFFVISFSVTLTRLVQLLAQRRAYGGRSSSWLPRMSKWTFAGSNKASRPHATRNADTGNKVQWVLYQDGTVQKKGNPRDPSSVYQSKKHTWVNSDKRQLISKFRKMAFKCDRSLKEYEVEEEIGHGTYGTVYKAKDIATQEQVALKQLHAVNEPRKDKVRRELFVLQQLCGGPGILPLKDFACYNDSTKGAAFVFPYVDNLSLKRRLLHFTDKQVRWAMFRLLQALDYTHQKGIIHSDVKHGNVLMSSPVPIASRKRLPSNYHINVHLIDWTLADFYFPGSQYSTHVNTIGYQAPELLLGYRLYDYTIDMWGFGVILAEHIFGRGMFHPTKRRIDIPKHDPRWNLERQQQSFDKITRTLGTEGLKKYVSKYNLSERKLRDLLNISSVETLPDFERKPWASFMTSKNEHRCSPEAFDLLSHLLIWDHRERYHAEDAMEHAYFDDVRHEALEKPFPNYGDICTKTFLAQAEQ